jgi:hypothetical protein
VGVLHADTIGRASRVLAEAPQFTVATREARWTLTVIRADVIDAFAAVRAGSGQTLVQIELAILTFETRRTMADVRTVIVVAHAVV